MKQHLLIFILALSALLLTLHVVALKFNLYYSVSWADSVTHTLGGMIIAAILFYFIQGNTSTGKILLFTLFVGVLWEVFELKSGQTVLRDTLYPVDTAGDLFFDVFGAYIFTLLRIR